MFFAVWEPKRAFFGGRFSHQFGVRRPPFFNRAGGSGGLPAPPVFPGGAGAPPARFPVRNSAKFLANSAENVLSTPCVKYWEQTLGAQIACC